MGLFYWQDGALSCNKERVPECLRATRAYKEAVPAATANWTLSLNLRTQRSVTPRRDRQTGALLFGCLSFNLEMGLLSFPFQTRVSLCGDFLTYILDLSCYATSDASMRSPSTVVTHRYAPAHTLA